jgi:hypothetical protein
VPRQSEWYQHLPAALDTLRALPCPVVDRAAIETLFHLGRRQAIRFLARFGGYQSGKAYLLDRVELIRQLEFLLDDPGFHQDRVRRRRVAAMAGELQKDWAARQIPISPPQIRVRGFEDLPEAVRLEDGRLEIRFTTQEELLTHLLALTQALARELS